jgi:hypothetical protein
MKRVGVIILLAAWALCAAAEEAKDVGPVYADKQAASLQMLKSYKWTTDLHLSTEDGKQIHYELACRLNEKGEMVREVTASDSNIRRKRGFRGMAQHEQAEEAGELLDHVVEVTASYMYTTRSAELEFFEAATITDGTGDDAGRLIVVGKDVTVDGDEVTKVVDPVTMYPVRITYESKAGEEPITGEILFRPIEGGPNVPRMATIHVPSRKGEVTAEFINYAKQL